MSLSLVCETKEKMNLLEAVEGETYIVKDIATDDPEMDSFQKIHFLLCLAN